MSTRRRSIPYLAEKVLGLDKTDCGGEGITCLMITHSMEQALGVWKPDNFDGSGNDRFGYTGRGAQENDSL